MNNSGFSAITAELTCLEYLKKFYPYEVWDLSPIDNKSGSFKNIDEAVSIKDMDEFDKRLHELTKQDRIVIVTNMVQSSYRKFYDAIKKYDIQVIDTQKNNFGCFLDRKSALVFNIKMPLKQRIKRLLNNSELVRTLYKKRLYNGIKFDYQLSAYNFSPEEVTHFVKAHSVKYDEYLKNKEDASLIDGDYILYIDSATCYHPIDYPENNPDFDPKHHLAQLTHYFSLLEDKYKLPVVISLHPCSNGRLTSEHFGGRRILYSKTPLLIQHSKFVVSVFSTSLINVILAKKPSLIITSYEIEHSDRRNQEAFAFCLARMCGFKIDSLDSPKLPSPEVDKTKYDLFTKKYLVNQDLSDKSNGEILLDLIRRIEH